MRALVIAWLVILTACLGINAYLLNHANVQEHRHLQAASEMAARAQEKAEATAVAYRQLAVDVQAWVGKLEDDWRGDLEAVCLALEALAKMHPGRARVPAVGDVCPDVPKVAGGAHAGRKP